ncbi:MAG: polyamine ABC transporter substrate-binding protein [Pseudoxanthomonas sp.]
MDRIKQCALGSVLLAAGVLLTGCDRAPERPAGPSKVLNVYNWNDYLADDTVPAFERRTGIRVTYDVFDSNEMVEARLLAGSTGYDVVVPTLNFLARQVQAGVFQPLDKTKLPNLANLDPELMRRMAAQDPGNAYGVPYMWGTTGVGFDVDKVTRILGSTEATGSWDIIFKPELISQFKACGVTLLDTPSELIPIALHYLGEDPNSTDPAVIGKAAALLAQIRPYVTNFHSSQYIDALANGDTCLVVGWSGDVIQARNRAREAGNGVKVGYAIPREGAPLYVDVLAIPKDAKNVDNAYAFINMLLDPSVAAKNSDVISYPNPVPASRALMDPAIARDPAIYPSQEVQDKLFTFAIIAPETDKLYTRVWNDFKTGR